MKIRAQIGLVLNLDKCIGCHTCSVTCKNVWSNRPGMEYVWFNNVETKPGIGYPKSWENQNRWRGGWSFKNHQLNLKRGQKLSVLSKIFANSLLPDIDDYYEPFSFNYQKLQSKSKTSTFPTIRPISCITGKVLEKIERSASWDDNLGGVDLKTVEDLNLNGVNREIYARYKNTFMMYLPRLCEHCLNPACVASCPSGSIYKREEDGIVLVDQDKCKGWRMCVSGCPYKKIYYNWSSGKAEKCIFCYPRLESGMPTICSETCVGRIRYMGVLLYDADRIKEIASTENEKYLYEAQRSIFLDPTDPKVIKESLRSGISQSWIDAAQKSPVYKMIVNWEIALPLHPEYRTLPMIWYIPPLSPIIEATDTGKFPQKEGVPDIDYLRIPIQYLANLFTAGNQEVVKIALKRLLVERKVVREYSISQGIEQFLQKEISIEDLTCLPSADEVRNVGLTFADIQEMHSLLAIANYRDRFVIPSANRNSQSSVLMQGKEGDSIGSSSDTRRRAEAIFGKPMNRHVIPIFESKDRTTVSN